jgi:hypothetical protein
MAFEGSFIVAQTAKLTVNSGKADELTLRGLQSLSIPIGATASTTTVQEMGRRVDLVLASGLAYEVSTVEYNFVIGDPSQDYMLDASRNATEITDARFYVNNCHFAALDLISDSGGYLQIGSMTSPSAAKNEVFSGSVDFLPAGSFILFPNHTIGTRLTFTADTGTGAEIADSDSKFVENGFTAGDTIILDYVNSLDPLYCKINVVTAGLITLVQAVGDEASVPDFSGDAETAIHSGVPVEISGFDPAQCQV